MMTNKMKHSIHCSVLITFFIIVLIFLYGGQSNNLINPWTKYGTISTLILYILRIPVLFFIPQTILGLIGLMFYNAFPSDVNLKFSPLTNSPFICIRVVTKGLFPDLVKENVSRNISTCLSIGLENFKFEIVTDIRIGVKPHRLIREIVVPDSYRTRRGALFKARALQYCLEDDINELKDDDWVVHLDEETILTENSLKGILNFIHDGTHPLGQGLITYGKEEIVNYFTTFADCYRVADDMGRVRSQFSLFHAPLLSWKGSFIVAKMGVERAVSFDNGPEGSVAEDCYFAMRAYQMGYTFSFIEGEMLEKSPFTVSDIIQQRKRWFQGIWLIVHSNEISEKYKFFLRISLYSWVLSPLSSINIFTSIIFPVPCPFFMDIFSNFFTAYLCYMYLYGALTSFSKKRLGIFKFILCALGALITIPVSLLIENLAAINGLSSKKIQFHIVNKKKSC